MRIVVSLAVLIASTVLACADSGGVIAVPGKRGVPVFITGRNATYAMVEGDWGLSRGIHVQPTVYGGWDDYVGPPVGHYYPSSGRRPGYGRFEIQPSANRQLPQPAQSVNRSWSAQSAPPAFQPDTIPAYPPPVIVAPAPNRRFRN